MSARGLGASDSTSKTDASPVTIADYGSQAALNLLLLHTLAGEAAVSSLLSGAGAPASFRVLGEESASSLEEGDPALLAAVLAAFSSAMAPKAELAGVVAGGGSSAAGGAWTSTDVLRALAAGSCQGGLACEGEGEGRGYWTMDPIDGTKGYLRGGQYAVGLAYIRDGTPVLAVMACPCLPLPTWEGSSSPSPLGALFAATLGGGATQEPLFAEGAAAAAAAAQPTPITTTPAGPAPKPAQHLTLCESFESGHSNRAVSEAVARALGLVKPPIRMDSMGKYALVARGCGDVYFRCVRAQAPGLTCTAARQLSLNTRNLTHTHLLPHPTPLTQHQDAPWHLQRVRVGPRPWLPAAARGWRRGD